METRKKDKGHESRKVYLREDLVNENSEFYKICEETKQFFSKNDPLINKKLEEDGYVGSNGYKIIIQGELRYSDSETIKNLHPTLINISGTDIEFRSYVTLSARKVHNTVTHQCGTIDRILVVSYGIDDFGIVITNNESKQLSFKDIIRDLNCKNTFKSKLLSNIDPEFKMKVKASVFEVELDESVDDLVDGIKFIMRNNYNRCLSRMFSNSSNSFLNMALEVIADIVTVKEKVDKNVRKITVSDFIPVTCGFKEHIPGMHEMVGLIPKSGLVEYDDNTIREMNAGELDRVPAFNAAYKHIIETLFNPDEHGVRSVEIPYSSREGDCTLVYHLNMKWIGEYMSLMSISPIFIEQEHKIEKARGKKLKFNITGLYSTCDDEVKIKTVLQNIFSKIQLYTTTDVGEEPCQDVNFEKGTLKSFEPTNDGLMRLSVDLEFTSNEDVDTKDRKFILDYCGNQIIGEEDPRKSHDLRLARSLIIRK